MTNIHKNNAVSNGVNILKEVYTAFLALSEEKKKQFLVFFDSVVSKIADLEVRNFFIFVRTLFV